jgi:hypothetical protein
MPCLIDSHGLSNLCELGPLHTMQCSRLKPSYEFHFERLANFSPFVEELDQIQDVGSRI